VEDAPPAPPPDPQQLTEDAIDSALPWPSALAAVSSPPGQEAARNGFTALLPLPTPPCGRLVLMIALCDAGSPSGPPPPPASTRPSPRRRWPTGCTTTRRARYSPRMAAAKAHTDAVPADSIVGSTPSCRRHRARPRRPGGGGAAVQGLRRCPSERHPPVRGASAGEALENQPAEALVHYRRIGIVKIAGQLGAAGTARIAALGLKPAPLDATS
jgi:hypothetical protein